MESTNPSAEGKTDEPSTAAETESLRIRWPRPGRSWKASPSASTDTDKSEGEKVTNAIESAFSPVVKNRRKSPEKRRRRRWRPAKEIGGSVGEGRQSRAIEERSWAGMKERWEEL